MVGSSQCDINFFFTPEQANGITMSNLSIKRKCGVTYVSCWIKRNISWDAGLPLVIGAITSEYAPSVSAGIATFDFFGLAAADTRQIILKPHYTINADTNVDLVFSYPDIT